MTALQKTTSKKRHDASYAVPAAVSAASSTTRGLRPVTQVIRPVIKKILPQKSVVFQQLFDIWPDIATLAEAVGTIPEKLTFPRGQQNWGILSIWAKSSAQAVELSYNKAMLIQRINSVFGYAMIVDLRITAYPGKSAGQQTLPARVHSGPGITGHSLDTMLTGISNPALKTILSELGGVLRPEALNENELNH